MDPLGALESGWQATEMAEHIGIKPLSAYDPPACHSMRALHLPHDAWQQLGTIQPELSAFFWSKGP